MSIVCALHAEGETWIGSDRRGNDSSNLYWDFSDKVTVWGDWAVAAAGDHRTNNVFAANAERILRDLPGAFEATKRIREVLEEDGYTSRGQGGGVSDYGQSIVLASPTTVWDICGSFSILEVPEGRMLAAGSGREIAFGADWMAQHLNADLSCEQRVRMSVEAACAHVSNCGGAAFVRKLG